MTESHAAKPNPRRQEQHQYQNQQFTSQQPTPRPEQVTIRGAGAATSRGRIATSQVGQGLPEKQTEQEPEISTGQQGEQMENTEQDSQVGDSQDEEAQEGDGEELTGEEELSKMVKAMLARGFTADSLKKKIAPKTKKEKEMMRAKSLGEGRAGGSGRGRPI